MAGHRVKNHPPNLMKRWKKQPTSRFWLETVCKPVTPEEIFRGGDHFPSH
jgi:hypothetical protein